MKDKKFHTLQVKLTLLVGMIVMMSLIFFLWKFSSGRCDKQRICYTD